MTELSKEEVFIDLCTKIRVGTLQYRRYSLRETVQESPLPLTDPRDAVTQRMLNIPYHICLLYTSDAADE